MTNPIMVRTTLMVVVISFLLLLSIALWWNTPELFSYMAHVFCV